MDTTQYWQLALNIGFTAYLFLCFGVGCVVGHYIAYRVRG